jgi:hypothetical protein
MEQNKEPQFREPDQLTVKEGILKLKSFNRFLLSKWKIILLATLIGGAIGLLYASLKKTQYTAEITFVLDDGSSSGGGALSHYSALASIAGLDVGGSTGLFEGDNILELYKSRLMIVKTLLTPVSFNGHRQLLIERYLAINGSRKQWQENNKLRNLSFDTLGGKFGIEQDSILIQVVNDINKSYLNVDKPDKKLSIISVKVTSRDPLFAKAFAENIVANVNTFYIETKTKGSLQNLKLFQRQADSIRVVLNSSISGSAAAIDANPDPNPVMQVLRVPSQKRQVDIQANTALYAEAVKNLEIARSVLQRETPLIQIIDEPMLPLPNNRLSKRKGLINGGLIGFIIMVIIISVTKIYNKILS